MLTLEGLKIIYEKNRKERERRRGTEDDDLSSYENAEN